MNMKYILVMLGLFGLIGTASASSCSAQYANGTWYCYPTVNATTNSSVAGTIGTWLNGTTQGLAWTFAMFGLWIIMLFAMGNYNILARLSVSGTSFSVLTGLTTILGWTPIFLPVVYTLISVTSFVVLVFSSAT